jgi:hypothetical protein
VSDDFEEWQQREKAVFSVSGLLDEIGPRLFRTSKEILDDEEVALDKATFIIECLSLYRLLLLRSEDTVYLFDSLI